MIELLEQSKQINAKTNMEITFFINFEYLAYFMIGLGVGYLVTLGATGGPTSTERARHNVEVKKEFYKMLKEVKNGHSRFS